MFYTGSLNKTMNHLDNFVKSENQRFQVVFVQQDTAAELGERKAQRENFFIKNTSG